MGLSLKKIGAAASTGGLSGVFGSRQGKDVLFGKNDPGTSDRFIDIEDTLRKNVEEGRAKQFTNLGFLSSLGQKAFQEEDKSGLLARMQSMNMQNQLMGQAADQKRTIGGLLARKGIGSSSVGLSAMAGADRDAAREIARSRANMPILQEQLRQQHEQQKMQNVLAASSGINQIMGAPGAQRTFVMGTPSQGRSGGLLGLGLMGAGTALGAKYGGPQGAMSGMQMGQGFGQAFGNF